MNHRSGKLDMLLGKRLKITFSDGDVINGTLAWDNEKQSYKLKNCIDDKKGFMVKDKLFRKSNADIIERQKYEV